MHLLLALAATLQAGQVAPPAPAPQPGSELRVFLVTMGPGDAIWEKFGHNALWIHDPATGANPAYNWGVFDFDQPHFVARFLRGDMLYTLAAYEAQPMIDHYVRDLNRSVWIQELALTAAQKLALRDYVEWNVLPENAPYRYDYFRDNCSTRIRDALDRAMGGALREQLERVPTNTTYRFHTRRLTGTDLTWYALLQIGLGRPGDRELSRWEEAFLPMRLSASIREVTVAGEDGRSVPLVVEERTVHDAPGRVELQTPARSSSAFMILVGLLLGGALLAAGRSERESGKPPLALVVGGGAWALVAGITGLVLLMAWAFTDHYHMSRNASALLANPLSIALVIALPLARVSSRWRDYMVALGWGVGALAVAGAVLLALPLGQRGGDVIALLLPPQLALAWSVVRGPWRREGPTLAADSVSK